MQSFKTIGLAVAGVLFAYQAFAGATVDQIRERDAVRCGVSGSLAGFSLPDSQGVMQGLDADVCRAIAAALLGDSSKV